MFLPNSVIDRLAVKAEKQHTLCYCALCLIDGAIKPHLGTELHEIIPRSTTVKNVEARNRSYATELTVILCHECHQENHLNGERSEDLWKYNIRIYGRAAVKAALTHLQDSMRTRLGVMLPD